MFLDLRKVFEFVDSRQRVHDDMSLWGAKTAPLARAGKLSGADLTWLLQRVYGRGGL